MIARMDLLKGEGKALTPVDYKKGKVPDNEERYWKPDRVQLCAQALILREHGYTCKQGFPYYAASKTRVPVFFDQLLIDRTLTGLAEARWQASSPASRQS